MRITSVTTMKDEAPFILEWVAYHRLIGLNDILVFSNDCSDGTDDMLDRLDDLGLIRHFPNPSMFTGNPKHHLQVVRYVNTFSRLRRSDWVTSFDADEFICINTGAGKVEELFNAMPDTDVWSMSQLNFGHGGVSEYTDALMGEQFHYCWDYHSNFFTRQNKRGTKSMTRMAAKPVEIHNHSCVFDPAAQNELVMRNGSGTRITDVDLSRDVKSLLHPNYGFDLVQLNHYPLRSIDSFLLKRMRGNANHDNADYGIKYWRKYDFNAVRNDNIARWMPDVRAMRDDLLKDPVLGPLHRSAVENAQSRIAALKQNEHVQGLMAAINRYVRRNPGILPQAEG